MPKNVSRRHLSLDAGVKNQFVVNPLNNNKIESVEIVDGYNNKIEYTKNGNIYEFTMPESRVVVHIKYIDDNKTPTINNENKDNISSTNNNSENEDNKNNIETIDNKKNTNNPKTVDTITLTLIITILTLGGLNLLMVIKKRFN